MRETSRGRKREYLRVQTDTRLFLRKHEEKKETIAPSFQNRKHLLHNAEAGRKSLKEHRPEQKKLDHF